MAQLGSGRHASSGIDNKLRTLSAGVEIGNGIVVSRQTSSPGGQTAAAGDGDAVGKSAVRAGCNRGIVDCGHAGGDCESSRRHRDLEVIYGYARAGRGQLGLPDKCRTAVP